MERSPRARASVTLRLAWLALAAAPGGAASAGEPEAGSVAGDAQARARAAFADVARVLQSPRCVNCHPRDDVPRTGDALRPHAQNVTRRIESLGMRCASCHQDRNSPAPGPPGAPSWHLPPRETPMVFEGRSLAALCAQLRDPATTGGKDLEALFHHVAEDPLVLWGWAPGAGRTVPPLAHAAFVAAFRTWIDGGAACPEETPTR